MLSNFFDKLVEIFIGVVIGLIFLLIFSLVGFYIIDLSDLKPVATNAKILDKWHEESCSGIYGANGEYYGESCSDIYTIVLSENNERKEIIIGTPEFKKALVGSEVIHKYLLGKLQGEYHHELLLK